jgi:predicted pyridoxine 5'-phosphate oxidase superfamily flavin-nucleotide-binding protein
MDEMYHEGNRALQDRFDTRRLADRIESYLVHEMFTPKDKAYIESRDMFFLATADDLGRPTVSYKGGDPGFVRVIDDRTLAFPSYNGNGMYLSMGNLLENPSVGILFVDFQGRDRMRVNGDASIDFDDELASRWPEAQFVVRVRAREIFPNCPRYLHRYDKVAPSVFVPREDSETPVPSWKREDWASDVLPEGDPALDPDATVV